MQNIEIIKSLWFVLKGIGVTLKDIVPITAFLIVFHLFVLKTPINNIKSLTMGLILMTIGLYLFIQGLNLGLIPLGKSVGMNLPNLGHKYLIILFAFFLGLGTTLAEPALKSLALQIEEVSIGAMPNRVLIYTVAIGVGFGMALGAVKMLYQIPSSYMIIPLVLVTAVLGYLAPERIVGVAFDSAGVTTGPVTVPLNLAMTIGLTSIIGGSDPLVDGFGVIALASLGPIITVLLLGIFMRF